METFAIILSVVVSGLSIIGFIHKSVEKKIDKLEKRMDFLDDRMFLLSTGKTLAQAILEEKLKQKAE